MPAKSPLLSKYKKFFATGSVDIVFLVLVLMIVGIGLVMLYSASYPYALYKFNNPNYFITRQLQFAIGGILVMNLVSFIKYEYLKVFAIPLMVVSLLLLVVVLFLPPPPDKPDFKRWFNLGGFSFQPSEVAKFALILFCAWGMEYHHKSITSKELSRSRYAEPINKRFAKRFHGAFKITKAAFPLYLYGGCILVLSGLVMLENHLSGTILMLSLGALMMFIGDFKLKWFTIVGVVIAAGITVLIIQPELLEEISFLKKYAQERIVAWLDKAYEPLDARWQTNNALYAIGSGGFLGRGLGNSMQKHMFVSEPQNDMIFSIVCEELGFIGAAFILLLFGLLVWRGVVIGLKAKTRFGSLLAMGIVFHVGLQTLLNIAVATDSMPNTGISLPFFSYGGTALLMLLFEMGVVLSVSRYSRVKKS